MTTGPDFSEYDKALEDPEYRARLERPQLTPSEEEAMYNDLTQAIVDEDGPTT